MLPHPCDVRTRTWPPAALRLDRQRGLDLAAPYQPMLPCCNPVVHVTSVQPRVTFSIDLSPR
jgi:hypothetical protein